MKQLLLAMAAAALLFLLPACFVKNSGRRRSFVILAFLTTGIGALVVVLAEEHSRNVNLLAYAGMIVMFWVAGRFEAK